MKKNFLTGIALMVVAFFVATEIAQAADVTFSGQMRQRWESDGQRNTGQGNVGFNSNADNDNYFATRMRLNAKVNINDSTSAFIQMQSTRVWGNNVGASSIPNGGGSGNASFTGSDGDASVGLHEAYFTLKNFATLPVDLKAGRQQIVLDGHRLFGNTGWTTGGQTHDAIRLDHKGGNHTLTYAYIQNSEQDRVSTSGDTDATGEEVQTHLLRGNLQGILGGNLSVYFVYVDDGCGNSLAAPATTCQTATAPADNDIFTIGFRQAGQLFGIDYRGEYYYQGGDASNDALAEATGLNYIAGSKGTALGTDREAYMFGVRIGKKFNNVAMKPSITVWYDQLSGTDNGDINDGTYGAFNTLFDTGHKFYGHMDLFGTARDNNTNGLGLIDFAIKGSIQPAPGWTVKVDYHWFETEVDPSANNLVRQGSVAGGTDEDLGTEIDISVHNKYNANTKISVGWSQFAAERLLVEQRLLVSPTATWAYVQVDVKF